MASDQIVVINQLASRLENATSVERIYALQELQSHARIVPEIVGSLSLKKVLEFLQEQGSAEEYQEALDLIYRLVKCKDQHAAKSNTMIILEDVNTIELLLDLLNHEDLTVGVMTSQILTEVHSNSGAELELKIQACPDGMNKLLQRLPDSSREEVRNQAIVLIQQLTSSNEEMKKTVVFNEGFEILFGIIQREGGYQDAGLVVQDCLHICNNILSDSETCQRLFYAMGTDWILRLADFFDPALLESIDRTQFSSGLDGDSSDDDGGSGGRGASNVGACWFDEPARLACAVLALSALYRSLSVTNAKHQTVLATATSVVVPSAAFWLARRGPSELVNAGMSLLCRLVEGGNANVGNMLSNAYIKVTPAVPRKNFPSDVEMPALTFGWKPLPGDESKFINLLSLLAERYIFPSDAWDPASGPSLSEAAHLQLQFKLRPHAQAGGPGEDLATCALAVFERILAADTSIGDLIVQYILAPPPPPHVDGMFADEYAQAAMGGPRGAQLEVMRPVGSHVLHLLVDGCSKVLEGTAVAGKGSLDTAERAANVLAVVFIHGSQLGRELSTAISTQHAGMHGAGAAGAGPGAAVGGPKMILPMLLFAAGRTARNAGVAGYPLLVAILRLLACIASDCERAARQMLDDPANLFVVDLATAASESAGVPTAVQTAACMFLGCCFEALPGAGTTPPSSSNGHAGTEDSILSRKSFLSMIDGRIGLNRFTDILKRPLAKHAPGKGHHHPGGDLASFFISSSFEAFYKKQVDAIRAGIFEFYTGGAEAAPGDAMQQQLIEMQRDRITELELLLAQHQQGTVPNPQQVPAAQSAAGPSEAETKLREELAYLEAVQQQQAAELAAVREALQTQQVSFETERVQTQLQLAAAQRDVHSAQADVESGRAVVEMLQERVRAVDEQRATLAAQLTDAKADLDAARKEILALTDSPEQQDQAGELSAATAALQTQQALFETERAQAQLQLAAAQADVESGREVVEMLQERVRAVDEQRANLAADLDAARDEILALKERAVQDHQSNKQLQEQLDQRDRQIAMLTEEVRSTQSADGQAARKIADLEARNAELKQQLWAAEAELEKARQTPTTAAAAPQSPAPFSEVPLETSGNSVHASTANLRPVCRAALALVNFLGLHEDILEFDHVSAVLSATDADLADQVQLLEDVLDQCRNALSDCAGECSDYAEGAGLHDLEGDEGTVLRIRDCCRRLREALPDASEDDSTQLRLQLQMAEEQLVDEERMRTELNDDLLALQADLDETRQRLDSLTQNESKTAEASEEVARLQAELANVQERLAQAVRDHESDALALNAALAAERTKTQELIEAAELRQIALETEATHAEANEEIARLQKELAEAQERHALYETDVHALNAALAAERTKSLELIEASEIRQVALEKTVSDAQQQATVARKECEDLQTQLETARHNSTLTASPETQAELEEAQRAAAEASAQLVGLNASFETERSRLQQQIAELEESVRAEEVRLQSEKSALQAERDDLQNKLVQAQAEAEEKLKEATTNAAAAASEAQSAFEAEREGLRDDIAQLVRDHAAAETEWKEARHRLEERLAEAEERIAASREQGVQIGAEVAAVRVAAEKIVQQLQGDLDAERLLAGHFLTAYVAVRDTLETAERTATAKEDRLRAALADSVELTRRNDDLIAQSAAATERATQLQTELETLKRRHEDEVHSLRRALTTEQHRAKALDQEIAELRAANEEEFVAQDRRYADLLVQKETAASQIADLAKQLREAQVALSAQAAAESTLRLEIADVTQRLQAEQALVTQLRATYEASVSSTDALQSQEAELRRLTQSVDTLSQELNAKEQQLQSVAAQLRRREGENAGVLTTFESVKADLDLLRQENDRLAEQVLSGQKALKDKEREVRTLQTQLGSEQAELERLRTTTKLPSPRAVTSPDQARKSLFNNDLLHKVETELKDLLAALITKHRLGEYKVTSLTHPDGTKMVTISSASVSVNVLSDALALVDALRHCITAVVAHLETDLRDKARSLTDKEQEVQNLKRILLAFESSDTRHAEHVIGTPATPVRGGGGGGGLGGGYLHSYSPSTSAASVAAAAPSTPVQRAAGGLSYQAIDPSSLMTPSNAMTRVGDTSSAARWSGAKSALKSVSPTARQAARLHAEVLKERKKLTALQEQHSDLLSLLAQQDVELSVFRDTIQNKLGTQELVSVEGQARQNAIDLYGSYTQFRYDL